MILIWRYALQSLSLVLPHLQTSQQSLSVTFSIQTHNRCMSKAFQHFVPILSGARSFAARMRWGRMQYEWLWSAALQMATDTTGLLQRMLPRLDATHLAVCIAVSKLFETSPENRNHSQAFGCCQPCLPCMTDLVLPRLQTRQKSLSATFSIKTHNRCISKAFQHFVEILSGARSFAAHMHWDLAVSKLVLPRLQTRQQSLSVTFSIQTHNRCISKAFQHFVQILSGARSFAARMHWGRMLSNGFGRLHSNGYGHNWAVATDVTKIRCYSPGGMHCSL